jgi:hypothetical protein
MSPKHPPLATTATLHTTAPAGTLATVLTISTLATKMGSTAASVTARYAPVDTIAGASAAAATATTAGSAPATKIAGMGAHGARGLLLAVVAVAALLLAHCGGGSPTAPEPPAGKGELFFIDSGCACSPAPYPPIPIYVDGQQAGLLPVFGKLTISLNPGPHTWSDFSATDPTANHVVIQPGQALTVNLFTNLNCSDDQCSSDSAPMALRTPPSSGPTVLGSRPPR